MGTIQQVMYKCDQCGAEVSFENMMPGAPAGWLQLVTSGGMAGTSGMSGGLLFDKWECVRDYAETKAPKKETPSGV